MIQNKNITYTTESIYPLGDADWRAATGKVGYSKPNQGKLRCIRL